MLWNLYEENGPTQSLPYLQKSELPKSKSYFYWASFVTQNAFLSVAKFHHPCPPHESRLTWLITIIHIHIHLIVTCWELKVVLDLKRLVVNFTNDKGIWLCRTGPLTHMSFALERYFYCMPSTKHSQDPRKSGSMSLCIYWEVLHGCAIRAQKLRPWSRFFGEMTHLLLEQWDVLSVVVKKLEKLVDLWKGWFNYTVHPCACDWTKLDLENNFLL